MTINAIMVSVDYGPLLAITLPYNRRHFNRVMVVTSNSDRLSQDVALANGAEILITSAFYQDGALFNKWKALEEGLDRIGRNGWMCIMDADVLWPKDIGIWPVDPLCRFTVGVNPSRNFLPGFLYTPLRRMYVNVNNGIWLNKEIPFTVPKEEHWGRFPLHPQQREWAGYTQIFHAEDPVLGPAPWHELDWTHAGGADSFFQAKWPAERKLRPPFTVLHLGEAGKNWGGIGNEEKVRELIRQRRGEGAGRFRAEKITKFTTQGLDQT